MVPSKTVSDGIATDCACRTRSSASDSTAAPGVAAEALFTVCHPLVGVKIVRDGGDEFLVVGAPTRGPLYQDLVDLRESWPEMFRKRFGGDVPLVRFRSLVGYVTGNRLRLARENLGRRIGELKNVKEHDGAVIDVELDGRPGHRSRAFDVEGRADPRRDVLREREGARQQHAAG